MIKFEHVIWTAGATAKKCNKYTSTQAVCVCVDCGYGLKRITDNLFRLQLFFASFRCRDNWVLLYIIFTFIKEEENWIACFVNAAIIYAQFDNLLQFIYRALISFGQSDELAEEHRIKRCVYNTQCNFIAGNRRNYEIKIIVHSHSRW